MMSRSRNHFISTNLDLLCGSQLSRDRFLMANDNDFFCASAMANKYLDVNTPSDPLDGRSPLYEDSDSLCGSHTIGDHVLMASDIAAGLPSIRDSLQLRTVAETALHDPYSPLEPYGDNHRYASLSAIEHVELNPPPDYLEVNSFGSPALSMGNFLC